MQIAITHKTRYSFQDQVSFGLQQLRTTPRGTRGQAVLEWSTEVEGGQTEAAFQDHHGNAVRLISFAAGVTELEIVSRGSVALSDDTGVVGPHRGPAPLWLYQRETPLTKPGAGVRALLRRIEGETPLDQMHSAMALIAGEVRYEIGASSPDWDAETVLEEGKGVCQDHSHVFLAVARALGLPARYVSGYLRLEDRVDQVAMHAWAEAHVPDLGWVGFDVSNGISPDQRYVRVATGLDYAEAAPVIGSRVGGAGEALDVAIQVAEQ
ncbi:Protein containing transglutaminase-like domain, putative cysteine protease [Candidatus Rhodobacter oscarellae]|uniref:Protein containing transglutaminase-like domain, putative cysteine protease n=1 Tax=Candidatus Rhodobacter oscarellae TaxID=1675527 RepID=A0A0J9E6Y4_9RHOB|nr:transglutaminase family protein [Candidatus Rhodobacter lobularis]KMW58530.1 Protein containing transglutaminase-like domain, putative cysteine protease [Candidatus Rhodobacter lobularis]